MFEVAEESETRVLGRYSSTGDVAAVLNGFGKGWVGNVGPHPEADKAWCKFRVPFSTFVFLMMRCQHGICDMTDVIVTDLKFHADDDEEITNPEGVKFDVGHDLLRALMEAK